MTDFLSNKCAEFSFRTDSYGPFLIELFNEKINIIDRFMSIRIR